MSVFYAKVERDKASRYTGWLSCPAVVVSLVQTSYFDRVPSWFTSTAQSKCGVSTSN